MSGDGRVTVGVCTRDRHASVVRCLASLSPAAPLVARAVVVDDGSADPVEARLHGRAELAGAPPVTVLRQEPDASGLPGLTAGRNRILRVAETPYVLFLDDDAFLLSGAAVRAAVAVLDADSSVAAVAFAQADAEGRRLDAQPSPARVPSQVQAFIGFAHLVRVDALRAAGGYRERLGVNGEERELCLRLLDAGHRIVYLPDALVAHVADPGGRDLRRFLRIIVRNDCLGAMLNEPLPMALASVPVRLSRYPRMRRGWGVDDPGGFRAVVRGLIGELPGVLRERRAVRWSTIRRWRRLAASPPYHPPTAT